MNDALLRLFNAVRVKSKRKKKIPDDVLKRTIRNGYVLHPAIRPDEELLDTIEKVVGISGERANASFHKSWRIIRESSDLDLVIQQVLHYITTYGFEQLGIYKEETVYIPNEVLEIPEVENMPLTVVKAMTPKEIREAVTVLGSGIALAKETLEDVMIVVRESEFDASFADGIRNRELKGLLYDFYGICPSEPMEYLRYVVSKLTGESLLIKNDELIEKIKGADGKQLDELLKKAPDALASVFFRFKPLFLAMKSASGNKTFFNRLRKQADTMHKPMPEDYLNSVTARIKHGNLAMKKLRKKLKSASVFRKARLVSALNFRLHAADSIVYRIRNGRGWAADFEWDGDASVTEEAVNAVIDSIAEDVRTNVEGKTVYIPGNVNYAVPATEKQFTGYLPTGTYVSVPEDLLVGIHWTNTEERVDLDLSLIDAQGKIGWDGAYRSKEADIMFSGDVTDAPEPKGASELFYVRKGTLATKIMFVNYYNFFDDAEVPCKILVAHEKAKNFEGNYMVNPNNIIASANINVNKKQSVLALLTNVDGENRAYFSNVSIGNSITSGSSVNAERARRYLTASLVNSLSLRDVLTKAGAIVVEEKPEKGFIDLSPEALDKTTIMQLVRPKESVVA